MKRSGAIITFSNPPVRHINGRGQSERRCNMRVAEVIVVGEKKDKDDPRLKEIVRKHMKACNDELRRHYPMSS